MSAARRAFVGSVAGLWIAYAVLPGNPIPIWLLAAATVPAAVLLLAAYDRRLREDRILRVAPALLAARHTELDDEDLMSASGLEHHAVVSTLNWMERRGWVTARGVRYRLTDEGRTQLQAMTGQEVTG